MDRREQRFKKRTAVTKEESPASQAKAKQPRQQSSLSFIAAMTTPKARRCTITGRDSAAQRGRDACGTATRISTSLSRRLSALFGSTPDQGPKAAKFAVLTPGHAGFPNRAKRSEGSDTTPVRNAPVSPCDPLCAILLAKASVYPLSPVKTNVSRLCECDLKPLRRGLSHAVWDVASAVWAVIGGTYL